jgi:hypothetical protein
MTGFSNLTGLTGATGLTAATANLKGMASAAKNQVIDQISEQSEELRVDQEL